MRVFGKWREAEVLGTIIKSEFDFREQAGPGEPAL